MYIHFNFIKGHLGVSFPIELGEIKQHINFDEIVKSHYYLNNQPLINLQNHTGILNNIKKINLLVGTNNSGKSRFLRALFKSDVFISEDNVSYFDILNDLNSNSILQKEVLVDSLEYELLQFLNSIQNIFLNIQNIPEREEILLEIQKKYEHQLRLADLAAKMSSSIITTRFDEIGNLIKRFFILFEKLRYNDQLKASSKKYLPILRSLISDSNLHTHTYNKIIESKFGLKKNVLTGLSMYDEVHKLHNSHKNISKLKNFCEWIKNNFYKDSNVELMPDEESKNITLKIGDTSYPIYDLGDGIQQLILLMFPIYTAFDNTWFFIEEPETHLHPGLQRIFIETLHNDEYLKSKNLKFFFTTHSNHFLDLSLEHDDISIFQFEKKGDEIFNIKSDIKPNREILDLLGVNSSSVFLSNASIWVEGPTDRRYVSKWLKLYCEYHNFQYLREDVDFAFFEYGGNLIEHYLFDEEFDEDVTEKQVRDKIKAFAHSNKICLLADNDNASENSAKGQRRKKLEDISNKYFQYQNTGYREIENLLPPGVIKDFLGELVSDPNTVLEGINFEHTDYYTIGLGEFIGELFKKEKIKEKKFKAKSGTLNNLYKNRLCDFVVNSDYSYADLIKDNEHLDKLINDLYSFIKSK